MIEASASPERRLHDILDGKLDSYFHTDAVSCLLRPVVYGRLHLPPRTSSGVDHPARRVESARPSLQKGLSRVAPLPAALFKLREGLP